VNQGHIRRRCPKPLVKLCDSGRCGHAYEWRFSHDGRVFTGSEPTERAARAGMVKAMAKAEAGELLTKREQREAERAAAVAAAQQVRLGAYLTEWIERRTKLRENTRFGYRNIVRLHVEPTLGQVPVAELTTRQVRDLLEQLAQPDERGKVRTGATLSRIRSLLSGALQDAVEDGLIPVNVARGVRLPEAAAESKVVKVVFTPETAALFLAEADKTRFGPLIRFVAGTGVRRGEAAGLLWDAVDLEAGEVTIRRSLTKVDGQVRVDKPKTKKGERVVALDAGTVELLRELRREQAETAMRLGRDGWNPEGYVFVTVDGQHLLPDSITQAVKRITTALGLPDLHLHSLRHTWGSDALDAGIDVKVVSDMLGHSTTALTQNVYQHVSPALKADAAAKIAAFRRGSVAAPVASGGAEA
jgi:integrase